ncbi:MAG: YHS domain-containing protein [Candidatus Aquicultorales bacterium]
MARCITCAAMGHDVPVDEDQAKENNLTVEYQGKTYYFEGREHMEQFQKDPQKFIQMAQEKGLAA